MNLIVIPMNRNAKITAKDTKKRSKTNQHINQSLFYQPITLSNQHIATLANHQISYSLFLVSIVMVTGPSFTSATCISAPNFPL